MIFSVNPLSEATAPDERKWVAGDGGPLIVLQSSAVPQWQGADDFDNSLMNGGSVETDYDIICNVEEYIINRYNRDMLILDDSEWGGCLFHLHTGEIGAMQGFSGDKSLTEIFRIAAQSEPQKLWSFNMQDNFLRLLVGADDGSGSIYGYSEISLEPGLKQCKMYSSKESLIFVLSDMQQR